VSDDARKAQAFKAAVAWVAKRYGARAVVEAFGDAEAINAVWELDDLDAFRSYLWWRCKSVRRGAA
jgi:hypothetical protein